MTAWVLILMVLTYKGGQEVHHVPFYTEAACIAAGQSAKTAAEGEYSWTSARVRWDCAHTGKP